MGETLPARAGCGEGGSEGSWRAVADALSQGGAALFPTDTVFGLAVAPAYAPSPQILYELKGRPSSKPVAWLVGSRKDLVRYGRDVPEWAHELARAFWPGGLTLVVKASGQVPAAYQSPEGTIGLRMPDHAGVLALARELGCPLAATSANLSGEPAVSRFRDLAPELLAQVPAVGEDAPVPAEGEASVGGGVDGPAAGSADGQADELATGPVAEGAAARALALGSTVVDCTGREPRILREGVLPTESVLQKCGFAS